MNEFIERMAIALFKRDHRSYSWDRAIKATQDAYRDEARKILNDDQNNK